MQLALTQAYGGARSPSAIDVADLLDRYRGHLVRERGLAAPTVAGYLSIARQFLGYVESAHGLDVTALDSAVVSRFVVEAARHRCTGSMKHMVTSLRSLLRFLHLAERTRDLVGTVPAVAGCRGAALPRPLPSGHFERLLASCDRGTVTGRHDRAVLMLLGRLGLRVGELIRLELSDVDWRRGEVVIRGKARRHERLPLPVDVGEAVAEHILDRGPAGGPLLLSADDPPKALSVKRAERIVRNACRRAGIAPVTPHNLRHTAATEMLRAGASLIEVGQVLRHRDLLNTAVYAKVDRNSLRELARPWPVPAR